MSKKIGDLLRKKLAREIETYSRYGMPLARRTFTEGLVSTALGVILTSFSIAYAAENDFYFTPKLFYGWSTLDAPQKEALAQHYQVGKIQPNINNFSLGFDLGYKVNPYISIELDVLEFSALNAPSEGTQKTSIHKITALAKSDFISTPPADSDSVDSSSFDMGSMTIHQSSSSDGDVVSNVDVVSNGGGGTVPSLDLEGSQNVSHGGVLNNTDTFTLSRTVLWVSCKTVLYRVNPEFHTWTKAGIALVSFHAHSTGSKTMHSTDTLAQKNSMSLIPALGIGISYQFTPNVGFDFSGNYIFGIKNAVLKYPGIGFISAGVRFSFDQ